MGTLIPKVSRLFTEEYDLKPAGDPLDKMTDLCRLLIGSNSKLLEKAQELQKRQDNFLEKLQNYGKLQVSGVEVLGSGKTDLASSPPETTPKPKGTGKKKS